MQKYGLLLRCVSTGVWCVRVRGSSLESEELVRRFVFVYNDFVLSIVVVILVI